MRRRMWAAPVTLVLMVGLGTTGAGAAAVPEPDTERTGRHQLGDPLVDTAKEAEQGAAPRGRGGAALRSLDPDGDHQHGGGEGHLPGSSKNVALVGRLDVSGATGADRDGHIADVTVKGNTAYLAARRLNTDPCGTGGFYTVDISNPKKPRELSFTAFPAGSYPGEGMQVIRLRTAAFTGDVLVTNNEICGDAPPAVGGMSLYDVTNPKAIKPLAVGKGDVNEGNAVANQEHSVFAWQAGKRAYAMMSDDEEVTDVDIMDITDPVNPILIKETGILDWPEAQPQLANGETVFLHDMVVKKIKGRWTGLLSYWDAGWIILDLDDPKNPKFVDDSTYPDPEKLLGFAPEGNAHQAEWTRDNRFIVGTDEDFGPKRTKFDITTGPNAGTYAAGEFGWTKQIDTLPGQTFQGTTVWGGSGCEEDVNGDGTSDRAQVPAKSATGADIVVFTRGTCFFSNKVESGQLAGYDRVIVIQSHSGSRNGLLPNGFFCGGQGHDFTVTASAICVGHRAGHLLFGDDPEYTSGPEGSDLPALGTVGAAVKATGTFDGWGTVHLLDARNLKEIDNYAIKEGIDPRYASRFGDLTVHEVATDPKRSDLAYLSYYSGGLRIIKVGKSGIREAGHFVDDEGNNFWGIEAWRKDGRTYILASDRDSGLWIFRYTGR